MALRLREILDYGLLFWQGVQGLHVLHSVALESSCIVVGYDMNGRRAGID